MGVPDQFLPESAWTYYAVSLLLTVVCCHCHRRKATWTDLEAISVTTERLELSISQLLLFLGRSLPLFLGPEDVRYFS